MQRIQPARAALNLAAESVSVNPFGNDKHAADPGTRTKFLDDLGAADRALAELIVEKEGRLKSALGSD